MTTNIYEGAYLPGTDFSYERTKAVYGGKMKTAPATLKFNKTKEIDNMRNKRWYEVAALVGLLWVFGLASAHAESTYVETASGFALEVPEGWKFQAVPEGFNTAPFDSATNPFGMEGGRFPVYDLYLRGLGCEPGGGLIISPAVCPPQPKFIVPQGCYVVPQEVPEVEKCPGGKLVISPNVCDPND